MDAVDYVTYANLANINEAMRGGLCGDGSAPNVRRRRPDTGFQDAAEFLAGFQSAIDMALKRRLQ